VDWWPFSSHDIQQTSSAQPHLIDQIWVVAKATSEVKSFSIHKKG